MSNEIPVGEGFDEGADLLDMADDNRPYGEVTAEDLSTDDLIADGADLGLALGTDDPDPEGVVPVDRLYELDDSPQEETIDERVRQEEPDPATDVVPKD